jgi:hypothetical protein
MLCNIIEGEDCETEVQSSPGSAFQDPGQGEGQPAVHTVLQNERVRVINSNEANSGQVQVHGRWGCGWCGGWKKGERRC